MTPARKTSILVFTRAALRERALFRAVRVELALSPGEGRLWIDVSRRNGADVSWQHHLRHLADVGRAHYDLPWGATDLWVSFHGEGISLAGASASLPMFVAWIALHRGAALPEPFFATGVSREGAALLPAPREYLAGKLAIAASLAARRGGPARPLMWVPAGSDLPECRPPAIELRETPSLTDAVDRILGAAQPAAARP